MKVINLKGDMDIVKETVDTEKAGFVLFESGKGDDGTYWCSDCRESAPILDKVIQGLSDKDVTLIIVDVGNRETWKDPANRFRGEPFNVTCIPTIVNLQTGHRLEEDDVKVEQTLINLLTSN